MHLQIILSHYAIRNQELKATLINRRQMNHFLNVIYL